MKYRITRPDPLNWDIEQFQAGGEKISRGRFAGRVKKESWKVIGHYSSLKHAAIAILDKEIGDNWTGADIKGMIEQAQERVIAALADLETRLKENGNANDQAE